MTQTLSGDEKKTHLYPRKQGRFLGRNDIKSNLFFFVFIFPLIREVIFLIIGNLKITEDWRQTVIPHIHLSKYLTTYHVTSVILGTGEIAENQIHDFLPLMQFIFQARVREIKQVKSSINK